MVGLPADSYGMISEFYRSEEILSRPGRGDARGAGRLEADGESSMVFC